MSEDKITNQIIKQHRVDQPEFVEYIIEPEAHYNYYGDRGVVDLYLTEIEYEHDYAGDGIEVSNYTAGATEHLYEIKDRAALKEVTGANEVIRQFRRHCQYFYRDEERDPNYNTWSITFELCFVPSPITWEHIRDNRQMYRELENSEPYIGNSPNRGAKVIVTFRHPNDITIMDFPTREDFPERRSEWSDDVLMAAISE